MKSALFFVFVLMTLTTSALAQQQEEFWTPDWTPDNSSTTSTSTSTSVVVVDQDQCSSSSCSAEDCKDLYPKICKDRKKQEHKKPPPPVVKSKKRRIVKTKCLSAFASSALNLKDTVGDCMCPTGTFPSARHRHYENGKLYYTQWCVPNDIPEEITRQINYLHGLIDELNQRLKEHKPQQLVQTQTQPRAQPKPSSCCEEVDELTQRLVRLERALSEKPQQATASDTKVELEAIRSGLVRANQSLQKQINALTRVLRWSNNWYFDATAGWYGGSADFNSGYLGTRVGWQSTISSSILFSVGLGLRYSPGSWTGKNAMTPDGTERLFSPDWQLGMIGEAAIGLRLSDQFVMKFGGEAISTSSQVDYRLWNRGQRQVFNAVGGGGFIEPKLYFYDNFGAHASLRGEVMSLSSLGRSPAIGWGFGVSLGFDLGGKYEEGYSPQENSK